jgi:hypothetical protein
MDHQRYEKGIKSAIKGVIDSQGKSRDEALDRILFLSSNYHKQRWEEKKKKYKQEGIGKGKNINTICQRTFGTLFDWMKWFIKWSVILCCATMFLIFIGAAGFWAVQFVMFIWPYVNIFATSK